MSFLEKQSFRSASPPDPSEIPRAPAVHQWFPRVPQSSTRGCLKVPQTFLRGLLKLPRGFLAGSKRFAGASPREILLGIRSDPWAVWGTSTYKMYFFVLCPSLYISFLLLQLWRACRRWVFTFYDSLQCLLAVIRFQCVARPVFLVSL